MTPMKRAVLNRIEGDDPWYDSVIKHSIGCQLSWYIMLDGKPQHMSLGFFRHELDEDWMPTRELAKERLLP